MLEELPQNMSFQRDRATLLYIRVERDSLHAKLPNSWIDRSGSTNWSDPSQDLTPWTFSCGNILMSKCTKPNAVI